MASSKKIRGGKWGSELTEAALAEHTLPDEPPMLDTPIATASGFDLSRDMDEQVQAKAGMPDPVLMQP